MHLLKLALPGALAIGSIAAAQAAEQQAPGSPTAPFGRVLVQTVPVPEGTVLRSATYTPSGKVLVNYAKAHAQPERQIDLAVMDDDGRNFRPVWSGVLPERPKDNGIRFMVFPDNKRVFLGDFILECDGSLDACSKPRVLPVEYPSQLENDPHIMNRWSEMVVAPDNLHIGWNTLFAGGGGVMVFTGALERTADRYRIVETQIVSTLDQFRTDPRHADGTIVSPVRGGEIKQFIRGGTALSLVGAVNRDIPDSVVQDLASGRVEAITDAPGYDETTIFSPDERLGLTMTSRFSPGSDPAILGLMPRPYPASLNMGLSMFAYTYAVTGVRSERPGNVGPALIDIATSIAQPGYLGQNLNLDPDWVFYSPLSWHPSGRKGMWIEGHRGDGALRIRKLNLPDYRPGPSVAVRATPATVPYGSSDLSWITKLAASTGDMNIKVYGRASGFIRFRHAGAVIEKTYANFSDDGLSIYSGTEKMTLDPVGRSVYSADLHLTGPKPGVMAMQLTFGPLRGSPPSALDFSPDASGQPATRGFVEYDGRRLQASALVP